MGNINLTTRKHFLNLMLLALFIIGNSNLNAQHFGYLGKNFAVGYSGDLGLGLNYTQIGTKKSILFQKKNKIGLQYFFSNRMALDVNYWFTNFKLPSNYKFDFGYTQGSVNKIYTYQPEYNCNLKGYSAAIIIFKKGSFAPVGSFFKLEFVRLDYTSADMIQGLISTIFIESPHKAGTSYYANMGLGRNWILKDKFILSLDVEIGVNTNIKNIKGAFSSGNKILSDPSELVRNNKYDIENFYNTWVSDYLNNGMFVKYNLGIYYLFSTVNK